MREDHGISAMHLAADSASIALVGVFFERPRHCSLATSDIDDDNDLRLPWMLCSHANT